MEPGALQQLPARDRRGDLLANVVWAFSIARRLLGRTGDDEALLLATRDAMLAHGEALDGEAVDDAARPPRGGGAEAFVGAQREVGTCRRFGLVESQLRNDFAEFVQPWIDPGSARDRPRIGPRTAPNRALIDPKNDPKIGPR